MPQKSDSCNTPNLMHPDQAIIKLLDQVVRTNKTEVIQLPHALGRVLAEDLASNIDLPHFDNSSMDGYAFKASDLATNKTLTLIGKSFAGHPFSGKYQANSCVRIMTGAPVPSCYDTVQMQEKTQVDGDLITFHGDVSLGQNVRHQGAELKAGTQVLTKGTVIRAAEMGILATIGVNQIQVYHQLKVAFFSTGDELRPVGSELAAGQIYDSNRYSIMGLLSRANVEWVDLGVIKDDPEQIRQAFRNAAAQADLILTSGGVSVGEADFTKQILDEEGKITFWKMAIKPGKPFAFGKIGKAIFCGLPGNPVSSMVTFYKLVWPILCKMQGSTMPETLSLKATLTQDIKKFPGRVEYQRGILTQSNDGELTVSATGNQGSGMLTSMSLANCFVVLPQMQGDIKAGEVVNVEPFNHLLN